jgi:transposase-like protein
MAIVPCPPGSTMGRMLSSPYVICLGDAERAELESLSRRASAPFRLVLRSRIVLLAAAGTANRVIAGRLGICEDTARKWRRRYCGQGIEGLADAPRPGRPRVFPAHVVAGVKALACEMPAASGTPPGPLDLSRAGPPCGSQRHRSRALGVHRAPLAR